MRIYIYSSDGRWWAIAAEVPGTLCEDVSDRDEAVARCRRYAAEEIEAFRRLGALVEVSADEDLIDWKLPWWLMPDSLLPVTPTLRDAAVRRMDEIAADVDRFLDELGHDHWDEAPPEGWSVRRILDHVAGGFEIGIRRMQPWPLDPARAHAEALDELVSRLRPFVGRPFTTEQSGMNKESARIRWTPRKVLRATAHLQVEAAAHYGGGSGPVPSPVRGHTDAPDDDEPIREADLRALIDRDAALQRIAARDKPTHGIAMFYRYYRDRLTEWPVDAPERWRVMRGAFTRRLLALDERDLALVRVAPNGQCTTIRMELGLGLSHVREHLLQMRAARGAPAPT